MKKTLLISLILISTISITHKRCKVKSKPKQVQKTIKVKYTVYNAVVGQCDDSPLITADMSKIDTCKLNRGKLKWIAISRDLDKVLPMATKVLISKAGKFNGVWIVHDRMNKRFTNKIDFLVPSNIKLGKGFAHLQIIK